MIINTSRFGQVEVDGQRVITFPNGILGFPRDKRYVLIQPGAESHFYWLHSVETPDLGFVVTDPSLFVSTYCVSLKPEQMQQLGLGALEQAQVFVIVNKRGNLLTGNLQGPLVVNVTNCTAAQLVLSDRQFNTRVPLIEVGSGLEAVPA